MSKQEIQAQMDVLWAEFNELHSQGWGYEHGPLAKVLDKLGALELMLESVV